MKPLEGFRVLSLETWAAGQYGSQLIAALGAEIVKIENAASGGDPARYFGPHRLGSADSQYYQGWNTNKRSVALDLKSADGRRDFEALVRSADAVMNNLRGDLPAKLGLDYATLGELKPSIVCLHISAYGRDNERAAWPVGLVYGVEQALRSPFALASGMIKRVPHPERADLRLLTSPIKVNGEHAELTPVRRSARIPRRCFATRAGRAEAGLRTCRPRRPMTKGSGPAAAHRRIRGAGRLTHDKHRMARGARVRGRHDLRRVRGHRQA